MQANHALKEANMRMLLRVEFPHEPFNSFVKDGSAGAKMMGILNELKPEAVYFTDINGHRCGLLFFQMENNSQIPAIVEPWFLTFNADCHVHPVMVPEDLAKADLAALGKKWA
jgi:hypothetical protein